MRASWVRALTSYDGTRTSDIYNRRLVLALVRFKSAILQRCARAFGPWACTRASCSNHADPWPLCVVLGMAPALAPLQHVRRPCLLLLCLPVGALGGVASGCK